MITFHVVSFTTYNVIKYLFDNCRWIHYLESRINCQSLLGMGPKNFYPYVLGLLKDRLGVSIWKSRKHCLLSQSSASLKKRQRIHDVWPCFEPFYHVSNPFCLYFLNKIMKVSACKCISCFSDVRKYDVREAKCFQSAMILKSLRFVYIAHFQKWGG